jgi:hypothetical protein
MGGYDTTYTFELSIAGEVIDDFMITVLNCENLAGPDTTICAGDTVSIGLGCLPVPHPLDSLDYCYYWEPSTGLSDVQSAMPSAFPDVTTPYIVHVTTSGGELIAEDSVVVSVNPYAINILPENPSICFSGMIGEPGRSINTCPDGITLSVDHSNYTSLEWSTGSTADTILVSDTLTLIYSVTATAANGCQATDEVELGRCLDTPLEISASNTHYCGDSITLNVAEGYTAYNWSDGGIFPELVVDSAGTYSVTVEDSNGCIGIDSMTIEECNAVVDISIYDGFYDWVSMQDWSGGNMPVPDDKEYKRGAVTLANLNDTDGDGIPDNEDMSVLASSVGRNEIDLMRLDIPNPLQGGNLALKLHVLEGADKVAFWTQPFKGSQLTGMNGEYTINFEGETSKTFYIEAVNYSEDRIDIIIEASYANSADTVTATAYWVVRDSVHLSTPTMQQVATPVATYDGNSTVDLEGCIPLPGASPLIVTEKPTFYKRINCQRIANNGTLYGFGPNYSAGLPAEEPTANCITNSYPGDSSLLNPNKKIGARIFWEFKIKPTLNPQIYDSYKIRFDVTRQKSVNTTEMISGEGQFMPSAESPVYFPWLDSLNLTDNERANDDAGASGVAGQNDNSPNADCEIYSYDPPGINLYDSCNDVIAFKVFRASFKEFVRVKINDAFETNEEPDSSNVLEGSRASYKEDWYTVFHVRRSSTGLYVMSLDTDSISVSTPFKVSNTADNGTVTLNIVDSIAANITTNGYRLTYTADSTRTWNVARMMGGMPVTDLDITPDINDEKKWNAVFEGINITITENDDMEFQDGHSYTYSTFKTENPSGKINEMGLGTPPFNIFSTSN